MWIYFLDSGIGLKTCMIYASSFRLETQTLKDFIIYNLSMQHLRDYTIHVIQRYIILYVNLIVIYFTVPQMNPHIHTNTQARLIKYLNISIWWQCTYLCISCISQLIHICSGFSEPADMILIRSFASLQNTLIVFRWTRLRFQN